MMEDDDLVADVYQGAKVTQKDKARGRVLQNTNALLGRIGAVGDYFCISLWSHPSSEVFGNFLAKLYQKFPNFQKIQSKTLVIFPGEAKLLTTIIGGSSPNPKRVVKLKKPKVKDTPRQLDTKQYVIGNGSYSLSDLQQLRSALHTKANTGIGDPMTILCHPDMAKYSELAGYRPATCGGASTSSLRPTHPANWRQMARTKGIPNVYDYGENNITFADWFEYQNMFDTLQLKREAV
jgi:hypothetical protein